MVAFKCLLKSLLNQDILYTDCEIICINDGFALMILFINLLTDKWLLIDKINLIIGGNYESFDSGRLRYSRKW